MPIKEKSKLEFIILMASLMSLVALSIDILLPALKHIGIAINSNQSSDNQLLITMIFLGEGIGQLLFGPLSDSFGRKPIVYIGFIIFIIASFICIFSTSLQMMVFGRILQGIGLSSPRVISISMIRDRFSGNYMAKVMSFIASIFIIVPIIGPAFGKILFETYGWKSIFSSQLIFGSFILIWFWRRQPETLSKKKYKKLSFDLFINGTKEFIKNKHFVFTLVLGLINGSFMVYLSGSQHIFQEQYNLVEEFPYIFAGLAFFVGFSTFLNGTFVLKYGMFKLVSTFTIFFTIISLSYLFFFYGKQNPNIYILLLFFGLQLVCVGFLFGNLRALAMQSIGHIAGIGAALNSFISTLIAVPIAVYIGKFVNTTVIPVFMGFLICGILSLILILGFKISKKQKVKVQNIKTELQTFN